MDYENLMIIRGERKIWYGVSGEDGGDFDKIVKEMVPELFEHQPDLLHHITTIFNPRVLMQKVFIISFHWEISNFHFKFYELHKFSLKG